MGAVPGGVVGVGCCPWKPGTQWRMVSGMEPEGGVGGTVGGGVRAARVTKKWAGLTVAGRWAQTARW